VRLHFNQWLGTVVHTSHPSYKGKQKSGVQQAGLARQKVKPYLKNN
jgi:hypothetical protein